MTSITWLHISDLHVCHPKYGTNHQEVTEKLVEDFRRLNEEHGLFPDMIFFTGDAVFGQIEEEEGKPLSVQYAKANRFLESIRTTCGEDFPKSNDARWLGTIFARKKEGTVEVWFEPTSDRPLSRR